MMEKKYFGKKGDVPSTAVVGWTLALVGLALILLFFASFNFEDTIDREVCHQSVVYKATLPDKLSAKELVPLQCKTREVCFYESTLGFGKGDCGIFGKSFESVDVNGNEIEKESVLKQQIADDMVECWNMMGQGKLQVFEREIPLHPQQSRCVICSVIDFDDDIKNSIGKNEINGFRKFLLTRNAPQSNKNYYNYLTNGGTSENFLNDENYEKFDSDDVLTLTPKAVVYVETSKTKAISFYGGLAGSSLAFFTPLGGIGFMVFKGVAFGGLANAIGQKIEEYFIGNFEGNYVSGIALTDYDADELKKLDCVSFESIP